MLKKFMSLLSLTTLLILSIVTFPTHAQEQTYATLLKGETFNEIIKTLAAGHAVSGSADDNTIKTIKRSNTEPSQSVDVMTGSTKTSDYLIKIWFDGIDTIYYYTEAKKIYMNSNSSYLFRNLKALENLDLTIIDTSKVTNMQHMFLNDININSLDLRSFDTSNVTNMYGMFNGCYSLTYLDLSSFNTSNVTNMQTMFYELQSIETLDLRNFDTSKVTNMQSMFANNLNITNLTTIYVSDKFKTDKVTSGANHSNMFGKATKLVGGNGTKFDPLNKDKTYAKIDSERQSGYFTDKITAKLIDSDDNSVVYTQTLDKGENIDISNLIKTGYSTLFYEDSGATIGFDIEQPITKYTEIYFRYSINKYTITFDTDGGNNIESITEDYGTPITAPENPIKDGYKFIGWNEEIPSTMPAENMTIKAKREKIKSNGGNGYSGGGNGGSRGDKSTDSNRDNTKDQSTDKEGDGSQIITGKNEELNINTCMEKGFSKEMCDTYNWAYNNGLTQYNNIKDARFNSQINRQEMAKISSIFVNNKLFGKSPDTSKQDACSQFVDLNKVSSKMKPYIVQICELGYMGYKANGTDILEKFRPYASITLAEMSTTLSRIVWGNKYAGYGNKWYQGHLYAVYENNLIDDINNPYRTVTRGEAYNAFYKLYQLKHD